MAQITRMQPHWRRIQAFVPQVYHNRLEAFGYTPTQIHTLTHEYVSTASLLDDGTLVCMLCDPWPKYCPDYDRARIPCTCTSECDLKTPYIPSHTFGLTDGGFKAFERHLRQTHPNVKLNDRSWFKNFW